MDQIVIEALKRARNPEPLTCPVSGELMYAPLDKLSIGIYNKSIDYIDAEGEEGTKLLELAALI